MPRVLVLYYSRTGNTEKTARAAAEGVEAVRRVDVELSYYVASEVLNQFDALVVGTPTYHHEMTLDLKELFEEAAVKNVNMKGKLGAAFGSYGWSGEAPRMVVEIVKNKFEMNVIESSLLVKYVPDTTGLGKCRELGKRIAERLMHVA